MDDMEMPSKTAVIKITENSERASEDTEVMSTSSNSIRDFKEITSGSMITIPSIDEKTVQDEQKDQDDQGEQKSQNDQGDQGNQGVHGEITSELHLASIDSAIQALVMESSMHSICMESVSMITIASTDEKTIEDEQKDQDDQGDLGDQVGHWFDEDLSVHEDIQVYGDLWVNEDQKDQEPELKQHKAKPHDYICVILLTFLCMSIPFIWYHLSREDKVDAVIPGQTYNQAEDVLSNNSCPFWHLLGDNYCDDEANIPECGYDLEDCCKIENDRSICTDCLCFTPEDKKVVIEEEFIQACLSTGGYANEWFQYFGDGHCDLGFNNQEYFFDIGDCCLENPTCMSQTFLSTGRDLFCDEDICIKSNLFCVKEELGDGICQGHNNGPYCDHDLGDCCLATESSQTNCTCNCRCFMHAYYQVPWIMGPNQPNMYELNLFGNWK